MANPTVKSLAADVGALQDGMAAILAAVQGNGGAEDAPAAKATGSKAKATARKAGTIRRNLDPMEVECGDVTFKVAPSSNAKNGAGVLYRRGARVMAPTGRSFTEDQILALIEHGDVVMSAIADVDERALIGSHLPDGEDS
jgi:hypothetical protein